MPGNRNSSKGNSSKGNSSKGKSSKERPSQAESPEANSSEQPDAGIVMGRVNEKQIVHNTILSWSVPDFEELRHEVLYFQTYERPNFKCSFRILKSKEGKLSLTVTSPCIAPNTVAEFLILDASERTSVTRGAHKLQNGVYTALFENSEFLQPEFGFLHQGVLTVAFKYASDVYTKYTEKPIMVPDALSDLDELCCDLKRMYLDATYPDFEVHVGEHVFSTHKFILAARSDYFQNILRANESLESHFLDDNQFYPGVVHEAFLFMYCGELKERSVEWMLQMYWTAYFLQVDTLSARCWKYFEEQTCLENFMDICKFAVVHQFADLEEQIIRFAPRGLPGINIEDVIARLKEDSNGTQARS